ncbi:hypothetical protein EUA06_15080 [Nocardioides glacieisoli]|uniref:ORC1/DEAH AAA+ ATPase domain-containing protein n=1 Tax=Nocardioides glacieisoli TaxID=1168730 RepID=A0A4Q2RKN7_9ACTN|nr:AAA family ATPase [Nocardioides glacieisoli]RYB89311.1 hypothetical protein EUA06_15080 [Nocardioides glacieisoli]
MLVNIEDRGAWHELDVLSSRREPFAVNDDPSHVAQWIHSVYIVTQRDADLLRAIQTTLRRNGATKRHWLAVDGAANTGKSEMLLRFAIGFQRDTDPAPCDDFVRLPIIYVQADSGQQGAGLLRAIAEFAGVPSLGNEDQLRRRLARVLPRLGTVIVIVDDAHMLRRASDRATRLSDSLRATLRLPVTFIFAGAGMHGSALLRIGGPEGYESTDQLRSRHTMLKFEPLRLPRDKDFLRRLLGDYLKTLGALLPHLQTPFRSDNAALTKLIDLTGGKIGAVMGVLKDGTIEAYRSGTPLTSELLLTLASPETTPAP